MQTIFFILTKRQTYIKKEMEKYKGNTKNQPQPKGAKLKQKGAPIKQPKPKGRHGSLQEPSHLP